MQNTKEKWYRCPGCKLLLSPDKGGLTECPQCHAKITENDIEETVIIIKRK